MEKELEYEIRVNFNEVLNRFNFSKVYDTMNYLGWTWGGQNHSPSQAQMIETVYQLFEHAIEDFKGLERSCSTGGFLVRIRSTGKVEIQFILTQSYSYD